jgi:predicted transposase/invertase (TIGR01784 family)
MLMTEFNLDDALDVRYEEGWEDGREEGWEKGRFNGKLEIARNLLVKGSSLEFVNEITGLDFDTLKDLQVG